MNAAIAYDSSGVIEKQLIFFSLSVISTSIAPEALSLVTHIVFLPSAYCRLNEYFIVVLVWLVSASVLA